MNTIAPGTTTTRGTSTHAGHLAETTQGTPTGRPVRPTDITYTVRSLTSDEAAYIHSATLNADGENATTRPR